jgi:hypothetical protein
MKSTSANDRFIEEIKRKFSKSSELVNKLMDILLIEKDAIYRRLRGEVTFTLQECTLIAEKLGISLDNITSAGHAQSRPFFMKMVDYIEPKDLDYFMMDEFNIFLKEIIPDTSAEYFSSARTIPTIFHYQYETLTKFHFFKWVYQYMNNRSVKSLQEVKAPDLALEKLDEQMKLLHQIRNLNFIIDTMVFQNLINDLTHFKDIGCITHEEIRQLKSESLQLIDYLEEIASKGVNSLNNKVNFYVSGINFDGNCSYINTQKYKLTLVQTFTLYYISSLDIIVFEEIKNWMNSLIKSSTAISEYNYKARNKFFNTQRDIIQNFKI